MLGTLGARVPVVAAPARHVGTLHLLVGDASQAHQALEHIPVGLKTVDTVEVVAQHDGEAEHPDLGPLVPPAVHLHVHLFEHVGEGAFGVGPDGDDAVMGGEQDSRDFVFTHDFSSNPSAFTK